MQRTFRPSRSPRTRGYLALSLVCIGLFSLINVVFLSGDSGETPLLLLSYSPKDQEPQARGGERHQLPQELIDFVRQGGFDDSEKPSEPNTKASMPRNRLVNPYKTSVSLSKDSRPGLATVKTEDSENEVSYTTRDNQEPVVKSNVQGKPSSHPQKPRHHKQLQRKGFPPLDRIVNGEKDEKIAGRVDWLLDFAILGHAKCATTYLMNWLRQHESVQMHDREICDLNNRQPGTLVRRLYTDLPAGDDYLRGYKCPGHFSREPLRYFRQYFPKTRLIVGLRHPVRWFESYYNFRIRHPRGGTMPPPERLLGKCVHESQGVCTDRANFHRNLAMLAKTNHSEPAQQRLLVGMPPKYRMTMSEIPNPVFLYDVGQLYDRDSQRKAQFQSDLEHFVGLDTPLPPNYTEPSSSKNDAKFTKLDICHSDFDEVRHELVTISSRAATWITEYFIQAESVFVSSPEYFAEILKTWHYDPCAKNPTN